MVPSHEGTRTLEIPIRKPGYVLGGAVNLA